MPESPAPTPEPAPPGPRAPALPPGALRKVVIGSFAGIAVLGALALYGDVRELSLHAASVSGAAVALGLATALVNYLLRAARFHQYVRGIDPRVPASESVSVFLCGLVMSITPGKLGELWKSVLLYESSGVPMESTAPIIVAERVTDLIAVALLVALGSVAFERGLLLAGVGVAIAAAVVVACSYRPFGEWALGVSERIPIVSRLTPKLRVAYDSLLAMLRPRALFVGTGIAFVAWGVECGALYVVARDVPGISVSVPGAVFAFSASTLAGAAAMVPGGLGVSEVSMTGLVLALGGPGATRAAALTITLVTRVVTFWFAVVVGLAAVVLRATLRRGASPK